MFLNILLACANISKGTPRLLQIHADNSPCTPTPLSRVNPSGIICWGDHLLPSPGQCVPGAGERQARHPWREEAAGSTACLTANLGLGGFCHHASCESLFLCFHLSGSSVVSCLQSLQCHGGYILWEGEEKVLPRAPGPFHPSPNLSHGSAGSAGAGSCHSVLCAAAPEQSLPMAHRCGLKGVPVHDVLLLAWDLPVGTLVPVPVRADSGLVPQVHDWTEDESSNQGLLVTVQGLGGSPLDPPPLQFASGRSHHESKKPMLVLFTDDGRRGASLPTAGFPGGSHTPGTTPSVPTSLSQEVLPTCGLCKSKSPSLAGGTGSLFSGAARSGLLPACRCEAGFEFGRETEAVTSWWLCLGW